MVFAIATVIIRIFAIWMIFQGLSSLVILMQSGFSELAPLIYMVILFVLGLLILWRADRLVPFFVNKMDGDEKSSKPQTEEIVSAGSFLIGLYWFIAYLPQVFMDLYLKFFVADTIYFLQFDAYIGLVISVIIMFSVHRIARFFLSLRKL